MNYLCWILCGVTIISSIYVPHSLLMHPNDYVGNSIYNGIHRQFWAVALCWIILSCSMGYGGKNIVLFYSEIYIFKICSCLFEIIIFKHDITGIHSIYQVCKINITVIRRYLKFIKFKILNGIVFKFSILIFIIVRYKLILKISIILN